MELLLLREIVVLVATAIAAYTDYKTGFIFDWITYPLIAIGLVLHALEWLSTGFIDWSGIGIACIVFGAGLVLYYAGKTGGGDVKLLAGIALTLPFFSNQVFVASVLLVAALLGIVVLGAYFITRYLCTRPDLAENKANAWPALLLGIGTIIYLALGMEYRLFSPLGVLVLAPPLVIAVVFLALDRGIRKTFFLEEVPLSKLEEDEIVAREFENEKTIKILEASPLGVLTKKEIALLQTAGIERVKVYRKLPPFGPFLLAGTIVSLAFPTWLSMLMPLYPMP